MRQVADVLALEYADARRILTAHGFEIRVRVTRAPRAGAPEAPDEVPGHHRVVRQREFEDCIELVVGSSAGYIM